MKNILETLFPPLISSPAERLSEKAIMAAQRYGVYQQVEYGVDIIDKTQPQKQADTEARPTVQAVDIAAQHAEEHAKFMSQVRDQEVYLAPISAAIREVKGAHGESPEWTADDERHAREAAVQKARQSGTPPTELKSGQIIYLDKDEALQNAYKIHDEKVQA